jgi:hypothetical protein
MQVIKQKCKHRQLTAFQVKLNVFISRESNLILLLGISIEETFVTSPCQQTFFSPEIPYPKAWKFVQIYFLQLRQDFLQYFVYFQHPKSKSLSQIKNIWVKPFLLSSSQSLAQSQSKKERIRNVCNIAIDSQFRQKFHQYFFHFQHA